MSNTIPKSLHTVRVLALFANLISEHEYITPELAVEKAAARLGYHDTPDTYGLKAKAAAQVLTEVAA